MRKTQGVTLVICAALLVGAIVVALNAQAISDWWKLRDYTPPASITKLADEDTMVASTKRVLYVNHAQLIGQVNAFRSNCPESEQTIVLGCYHPVQDGIYIYNVSDPRLNGIQEVTAAHEVLHAMYDRLSAKDKNYVDGLLNDYYAHDLHDERIINEIKLYQQTEPNDVVNEMHSVFGTEAASLPAPLENYYKRYFSDREAIVNFGQQYEAEFTSRTNQINTDDANLAAMKKTITSLEQSLTAQLQQIQTDRARLDNLQSTNQVAAYNAGVAGFNAEVDSYNQGVRQLQSSIAAYNQLVATRNNLAVDLRTLDSAIDTRLSSQPAR